nr:DUF166 family protein [Candidatus Njordarchaeota archaeon]
MRIYVIYNGEFGERVIGNLINDKSFCKVCGASCTDCRWKTNWSYCNMIAGVNSPPENLPTIIDNPQDYLPKDPPRCDVVLSIGIHADLASALPLLAQQTAAKAVIFPVEDPKWMSRGLQYQLEKEMTEIGVETAFPKPFCSLEETGRRVIDSFINELKIGRPLMRVSLKGSRIMDTEVLRSAPCGSTWYIAEQIKNAPILGIEERIALAHHSYPCTASMENDPVLKEKILHKGGYMAREAVKRAIDEFAALHPEFESEIMQAIISTKRPAQIISPPFTPTVIEKEV